MSENSPSTPPRRSRSSSIVLDSQKTPTVPSRRPSTTPMPAGVEASVTSLLDTEDYASDTDSRYALYPARPTRSRAPSPTPKRDHRRGRSASVQPPSSISQYTPVTGPSHAASEIEPLYGNLPTVPPVPDSERRGMDGTLDAMDNAVEKTLSNLDFRTHTQQVIDGLGSLFPGNNIVPHAADTINEYIASGDAPPTITAAELQAQALAATPQVSIEGDVSPEERSRQMLKVINHQARTITGIQNILTHVLCQNVVLGTFNACVTKEVNNRITSFEHVINENIATVKSAVDGFESDIILVGCSIDKLTMVPPPTCEASRDIEVRLDSIESLLHRLLTGQESTVAHKGPASPPVQLCANDKVLDQIARKVNSIEQKVNKPSGANPPGSAILPSSPPRILAQAKGKAPVRPPAAPTHPQTVPRPSPLGPTPPDHAFNGPWYDNLLQNTSTERLNLWAAMISVGKWGPLSTSGKPCTFPYGKPAPRELVSRYVGDSLAEHMKPGSSWTMVSPPVGSLPKILKGWVTTLQWQVCNHKGQVITEKQSPLFAPGLEPEAPWSQTPKGGGKPKSFANAAKAATSTPEPKITTPQKKYGDVPTSCFMQPAPKAARPPPRSFGKKYMLKFHQDDKVPAGSRIPAQAAISEINRTCRTLNVRANTAEWATAGNLFVFFTYDSIDSQIEKARSTILGVLARGMPRTIFMKVVKWSRIVIRDFPTERWVAPNGDEMENQESLHTDAYGSFVKVSRDEIATAICQSHPILIDAIFMEEPNWTSRDGPNAEDKSANISFTVPDPDESLFRTLVRNPLIYFGVPCHLTRWTEKINLVRCNRCWKYGDKQHPDCPVRCGKCGGGHHEDTHNVDCKKCVALDIDHEERKKGNMVCTHPLSCPNCSRPHHTEDTDCPMRDFARCEARQRGKIHQNQAFITIMIRAHFRHFTTKSFFPHTLIL